MRILKDQQPNHKMLDPRAFETGTKCRFQNASHGLNARRSNSSIHLNVMVDYTNKFNII